MNQSFENLDNQWSILWAKCLQAPLTPLLFILLFIVSQAVLADTPSSEVGANTGATETSAAAIKVVDDQGNRLILAQPARRIVSLAPHITEMLFSAGAAEQIVGTVAFSDYPAAAEQIPRVGDAANLDIEAIVSLQPDLIVAWRSGTPQRAITALQQLGFQLYLSDPSSFNDIVKNISDLGRLSGHSEFAKSQIHQFLDQLAKLEQRYRIPPKVSVFYQIWQEPLMTVNGKHLISQVIDLCGGVNLFLFIPRLTPQISLESVMAKNVQAILVSASPAGDDHLLAYWQRWQSLPAVRHQAIYKIPWDIISRHSLRISEGAKVICESIEQVRQKLTEDDKTPSRSD